MNMNLSLVVYHVLMHQAEEGGYWCEVVEWPGCVAQGETEEEVLDKIRNVLRSFSSTETRTGYGGEKEKP